MADNSGLNGGSFFTASDCGDIFARVAHEIRIQSDGSIRHLAPDTPCVKAGNLVYNIVPSSALDGREKHRIGRISEEGRITFVAEAFVRSHAETPKVKDSDSAIAVLRDIAKELHIG